MSTFQEIHSEAYYHKGVLLNFQNIDDATVITGPPGPAAEFFTKKIEILADMLVVTLPDPALAGEDFLYYYKNNVYENDTGFQLQDGTVVGRFYGPLKQTITFLNGKSVWIR